MTLFHTPFAFSNDIPAGTKIGDQGTTTSRLKFGLYEKIRPFVLHPTLHYILKSYFDQTYLTSAHIVPSNVTKMSRMGHNLTPIVLPIFGHRPD